jgi:hypothetical protein
MLYEGGLGHAILVLDTAEGPLIQNSTDWRWSGASGTEEARMTGATGHEEVTDPKYVTTEYVMRRYSVKEGTLRDWILHGVLPVSKVRGRLYIKLTDIEEMMTANVVKPRKAVAS